MYAKKYSVIAFVEFISRRPECKSGCSGVHDLYVVAMKPDIGNGTSIGTGYTTETAVFIPSKSIIVPAPVASGDVGERGIDAICRHVEGVAAEFAKTFGQCRIDTLA